MKPLIRYQLKNARADLPIRNTQDNKTRGGKCLVIAGSKGMQGAAILTATAASRVGAGYTYLLNSEFSNVRHPDFLKVIGDPDFTKYQAIALGPGFYKPSKIKLAIQKMKKLDCKRVVLDAEALNVVAKLKVNLPSTWILTPHEGELSRMLKVSSATIRQDRKKYLLLAQKKFGCVILLKGHQTLIADSSQCWQIESGNPALAKAGTGDVLTGMIAGFLSQGLQPATAACLASFVHGYLADRWLRDHKDILSLLASDLLNDLPAALFAVRGKKK